MNKTEQETPQRLLRMDEVQQRLGLSRQAIDALRRDGQFVPTVRIGKRSIAFLEEDLRQWIGSRRQVL